jgi:hypothetical protein
MSPDDFIAKWRGVTLTERASAQEHFIDLCRMLGEQTPTEADPTGRRPQGEREREVMDCGSQWMRSSDFCAQSRRGRFEPAVGIVGRA